MSQSQNNEPLEILELFDKRPTVIKPGLSRIRAALDCLGCPGLGTPRIVVAGTNGKGTTSGMIWRLLSAAGFKVGLFTSPHLVEFRERITVSGHEVTNEILVGLITQIRKQLPPEQWTDLTFFEINTMLAFMVFEQLETEINVLEVGLGGRLDCVNVYDPDVAVITSIGLDHMEFLGDSLTLIAREKAGIMREGRPVIWCAEHWAEPEADAAITAMAKEVGAKLHRAEEAVLEELPKSLQKRPLFIQRNFQLARAAFFEILTKIRLNQIDDPRFKNLSDLFDSPAAPWPVTFNGRFDLLTVSKGSDRIKVLLDVCHNPHGALALKQALEHSAVVDINGKLNCLFSVLADKDAAGIWVALKCKIGNVMAFRSSSTRSWVNLPKEMRADGVDDLLASFDAAWNRALSQDDWRSKSPWLICGSVAMVGEVLSYWQKNGWRVDRVQFI
jgi:dihydrofolate synthase/folylpolyglutamate synthase